MNGSADRDLVLWRLLDGKPGHENQTLGLVEALARRAPVACHDLPAPSLAESLRILATGQAGDRHARMPPPDLLLGAGHGTHAGLLALRRARGGHAIVLMKPSLPARWFDLVIAPEHDALQGANVIATLGVLNRIRPGEKREEEGLVLIGGPSRHVRWDSDAVLRQLEEIVVAGPGRRWTLATSRRTPREFATQARRRLPGVRIVLPEETDLDWLPQVLPAMPIVWVTADSVSMLYEALSSGAAVGMIEVPVRGRGRVWQGVAALVRKGRVLPFSAWRSGVPLERGEPLAEADRVAGLLMQRLAERAGWS